MPVTKQGTTLLLIERLPAAALPSSILLVYRKRALHSHAGKEARVCPSPIPDFLFDSTNTYLFSSYLRPKIIPGSEKAEVEESWSSAV